MAFCLIEKKADRNVIDVNCQSLLQNEYVVECDANAVCIFRKLVKTKKTTYWEISIQSAYKINIPPVSARAFAAMQNLNIYELTDCDTSELRPLLPSLVRMTILPPLDSTKSTIESRKRILALLVPIEVVNNIVSLLQIDYQELEIDVRKEQLLR